MTPPTLARNAHETSNRTAPGGPVSKEQVNGYPLLDEETITASDDTDDDQGQDDEAG